MTRRALSDASRITKLNEVAKEIGKEVSAIELRPDGSTRIEFVARHSEIVLPTSHGPDEAAERVTKLYEGSRRGAA